MRYAAFISTIAQAPGNRRKGGGRTGNVMRRLRDFLISQQTAEVCPRLIRRGNMYHPSDEDRFFLRQRRRDYPLIFLQFSLHCFILSYPFLLLLHLLLLLLLLNLLCPPPRLQYLHQPLYEIIQAHLTGTEYLPKDVPCKACGAGDVTGPVNCWGVAWVCLREGEG